jgi:hypothetical protein
MNSGKVAGINPYDGNESISYLSFIDNFLSMLLNIAPKCFFDPEKHRIEKNILCLDEASVALFQTATS